MSKALKTVIAVGAAIAMPWAAPALASSIGLSTAIGTAIGSATAGSVIGGALTGAVLNAATAAITGGDPRRAALMGAISGGIGGYTAAPGATGPGISATPTTTPSAGISLPGAAPTGPVDYSLATAGPLGAPTPTAMAPVDYSLSGVTAPGISAPQDFSFGPATPAGTLTTAGGGTGAGLSVAPATPGAPTAPASYALTSPTAPGTGASTAQAPTGEPKTFSDAIKQVPGQIASRFTDPKVLADLTLRAAGSLAGSALAGDGLSPQEQQLLNEQVAELRQLRETNQALFNQRLEQAQNLIGESKYFDPEYFGLQRARRAQIAGARAKQAGLRGLTGDRAQAEARRFDIATGRETGTAYDVGYQTGIQGRLSTMQAGLNAMPAPMQMSPGYADLRATFSEAERRRRERAGDIGSLFGSLTGGSQSQSRGPRPPGG